jgi:MFS family permease
MGTTESGVAPVGYAATKELFPTDMAGTSIGTVNLFPFLGGAIFQPLIGYILDKVGKVGAVYSPSAYKMVILVFFIISLLGLVNLFFSKETIRK